MENNTTFTHIQSEAKRARQRLIVEAAKRRFAVKPFQNVSIREIAQEAGISHASIYRYFPDQQSLFIEAFLQGAGEISAALEKLIENAEPLDIMAVTDVYMTYLMDNDPYFRMMTHFMLDGSLSAEKTEKLNAAERRVFDLLDRMFQKMGKPDPVRGLSHAFFAALNGVLITFRNYPGRTSKAVRQHMLTIARIIARSFSTI